MSEPALTPEEKVESQLASSVVVGARTDWVERIMRTLFQLITAGVLTTLLTQVAQDIPTQYRPYIALATTAIVVSVQNYAEQKGWVPKMLKPGP